MFAENTLGAMHDASIQYMTKPRRADLGMDRTLLKNVKRRHEKSVTQNYAIGARLCAKRQPQRLTCCRTFSSTPRLVPRTQPRSCENSLSTLDFGDRKSVV